MEISKEEMDNKYKGMKRKVVEEVRHGEIVLSMARYEPKHRLDLDNHMEEEYKEDCNRIKVLGRRLYEL